MRLEKYFKMCYDVYIISNISYLKNKYMKKENESMMMDEMKDNKIYEISFILDNHLSEADALQKAESFKNLIASLSGSFISEETPYMRELSYQMIRVVNNINVRFKEGYFGWIKFEINPTNIKELESKLKLDENIIRYLVIKTKKENDIFTQEFDVIKSDPTILSFKKQNKMVDDVNIDTTSEEFLEEENPEIPPVEIVENI